VSDPAGTVRLRDGVRDAALVFLAVRVGLLLISAIGAASLLPIPPGQPTTDAGFPPPSLEAGWHVLVTGTQRQDALWFLHLATDGWATGDGSAAFFPVYPLLVRVIAWFPGVGPLGASLLVSNLAFLAALVVFHGLTRLELGDRATARVAVRSLAIFPAAFFFLAPYSEAPFLALSLLAFWFARGDRWGWAAATGALAALTRSVGVLLVLGLAFEAVQQWREDGRPLLPRLAASAGVALGPLAWLAFWQVRFGHLWEPLDAQRRWGRETTWPVATLVDAVRLAWRNQGYWALDLVIVAAAIAGVALAWHRVRSGYLAYAVASLALPLLAAYPDRPLLSMPRFVIVVFPAAWGYALAVRSGKLPDALVTGTFAAGYGVMATLFVAWQYVF
jgi:hypothetical protein